MKEVVGISVDVLEVVVVCGGVVVDRVDVVAVIVAVVDVFGFVVVVIFVVVDLVVGDKVDNNDPDPSEFSTLT